MSLWIFGYGSLLFRPAFPYDDRLTASVPGYMRRLDQGSPDHRGTEDRLGRVATLIPTPGARTLGAVFRVADPHVDAVIQQLDHREQGGYDRITVQAERVDGRGTVSAVTWIASPDNRYHLGPADLGVMVAQIRAAVGPSGSNIEYVVKLADTLRALGIHDPHVEEVARALGHGAGRDCA